MSGFMNAVGLEFPLLEMSLLSGVWVMSWQFSIISSIFCQGLQRIGIIYHLNW